MRESKIMENIKIDLTKHHLEKIPGLAKLLLKMLGEVWNHKVTLEEAESWFLEWCNESIPLAYIALEGDKPVGIGSLQINDGIRPDLMPWLGDLCVDTPYQKRGIGKLLIHSIQNKAKELGYSKLYLFTHDPHALDYYSRLGWKKMGMDKFNDHDVTIMEIQL